MAAIWDFDDIGELNLMFVNAFNLVKSEVIDQFDNDREEIARRTSVESIFITGDWANDNAEFGSTVLDVRIFFSVEGSESESALPGFDEVVRAFSVGMTDVINNEVVEVPERFIGGFTSGVEIKPAGEDQLPGALGLDIQTAKNTQVFNLQTGDALIYQEGTPINRLPRVTLEQLRSDDEEGEEDDDEEDGEGGGGEEGDEDESLTEEERLEELFPDVPEQLRDKAVKTDGEARLEVTVGNKDTKSVEAREIYDFELVQATDSNNAPGFERSEASRNDVMPGVGRAVSRGMFGREPSDLFRDVQPPSTYPRTGVYIRNYLEFKGPAYILQMYNDYLVYLAYVNSIHNFDLRVGTYDSFRNYIGALKRITEMPDEPELISGLSQQAAASQGLSTIPDHPSIEGEKAPWLQSRRYYSIVEENKDSDIWDDPYGYLYGDEEEE